MARTVPLHLRESDSITSSHPASRTLVVVTVVCALLFGACVAVQSRINGELGRQLDDGYLAAVISFGFGLVLLLVAMVVWRPGRRGLASVRDAVATGSIPRWYVLGGFAGALLVLSQGLTAAALGVALFTVATVSGQTLSGLLIDRRGLGTMPAKALTVTRVAGSVLVLLAVILAVSAQLTGDIPVWMLVLPFVAGAGIGWQQAVNGQVRIVARSALTATFVNFVAGTAVLVAAFLVHSSMAGWPTRLPSDPVLYAGGAIGVIFIAGAAVAVRITGVLLLGLATIAGQLVMSLTLDLVVPSAGHEIAWTTVAGTALTLVAVAVAAIPTRARIGSASAIPSS